MNNREHFVTKFKPKIKHSLIQFQVQNNSPAQRELLRGDIITKVEDYDARDLRHEDAQMLFRTQDNKIRLVVRRDNKIAMQSSKTNPVSSACPSSYTQYPPAPCRNMSSLPIIQAPQNRFVIFRLNVRKILEAL